MQREARGARVALGVGNRERIPATLQAHPREALPVAVVRVGDLLAQGEHALRAVVFFGLELEPRPSPTGKGPFVQGNEVSFNNNNDDFCYGGAVPGHASQIAVAIFALHPGVATLSISNITLRD